VCISSRELEKRDLVQLEAELAFAHALALPAPGAAVAWVKAVRIDDADDDDDNDENDDGDDDDDSATTTTTTTTTTTLMMTTVMRIMVRATFFHPQACRNDVWAIHWRENYRLRYILARRR